MCQLNSRLRWPIWRLDILSILKFAAVLFIFAPQLGLLWQVPNTNPDSFGETAPSLWVLDELQSFLSTSKYLQASIYASVCGISIIGLFVIPFLYSNPIRIALALVFMCGCGLEFFLLDINGSFSTQSMLLTVWGERAQTNTLSFYNREIIRDGLFTFIILGILLIRPSAHVSLSRRWAFMPLAAVALVATIINQTLGGTQVFPIPSAIISNAITMSFSFSQSTNVHPLAADLEPNRPTDFPDPTEPGIDRIIVIMDESVRGDYLSISDLHINTTPFLSGDADIINFGVAVSGANCSTLSRMIFRFGIRPDQVANWRSALRNPTMWEYAKRAGYTTVFIDTYFGLLDYGSGFSPIESRSIDRKLSVLVSPTYVRDYKLIDVIADVLIKSHDEKIFLYVDKFGTHTPYINTYAPNYSRYGSTDGSEKEIVKAQYKNAISWSVDGFFEKLKDRIDLANTLLIYTSDHGQSLYDGGYKLSHCSVNGPVVPGEGYVPLFAMTHVESYNRELRQAARSGQGHFSHFEIFPTLLNAMGFEPSFIKGRYGRSLLEVPVAATSRGFYVGNPKGVLRRIMIDADPAAR